MAKQEEIVEAKTAIKKTGRGGKYNFPNAVTPENPDDVREALGSVLYWLKRGMDSKPLSDEDVEERVLEYLSVCYETGQRMTVEKLALALGVTRSTLYDWETGHTQSPRRSDIIKKAKESIAAYDADMVAKGKLNPVPYIFRAKNYYGMKDNQDITITPNNPITDVNPADIVQKYDELPD
jgi:transcriptional regulator with XRE-family HTH domain